MGNKLTVTKSNVKRVANSLASKRVVAGLPKDSKPYPGGQSVVEVAHDHEFGARGARTYTSTRGNKVTVSGIPERSFMRTTHSDKKGEWQAFIVNRIKAAVAGKTDVETIMKQVGERMEVAIKDKIDGIKTPPNSPQVVKDKGSDNPLVDTGHLIASIKYKVRDI